MNQSKYYKNISKTAVAQIKSSHKKFLKNLNTNNQEIIDKVNYLFEEREKGFSIYNKHVLLNFIEGYKEIPNFVDQFIKWHEYNLTHFTNNLYLEKAIILYGETLGNQKYQEHLNKNPWKNHQGKYSPFKKGSVNYSINAIKSAAQNRQYNTKLDYYLNKGFNLNDAKLALKERQSTFSLNKCIEKYGKDQGLVIFKNRQDKWQQTLNNKSDSEKYAINMKKHSGFFISNKPCSLYYIKFFNEKSSFYKIGITTKDISKRFNFSILENLYDIHYEIKFIKQYNSVDLAYSKEQYILQKFNQYRIKVNLPKFSTTEAFTKDVLEGNYGNC